MFFHLRARCAHPPRARASAEPRTRCVCVRARAGEKRTASRSADGTRRAPLPSHRVIASRRERDVDARAIVRSFVRFDSATSIRYLSRPRRRPTSVVARARARRRRSVVRVSRGRSRRHTNRIWIEFESNLNRRDETRPSSRDASSPRRPIVDASRLVSSRLVSSRVAPAVARRVVGLAVGRRVTSGPFPRFSYPLDDDPDPPACVCGRDES